MSGTFVCCCVSLFLPYFWLCSLLLATDKSYCFMPFNRSALEILWLTGPGWTLGFQLNSFRIGNKGPLKGVPESWLPASALTALELSAHLRGLQLHVELWLITITRFPAIFACNDIGRRPTARSPISDWTWIGTDRVVNQLEPSSELSVSWRGHSISSTNSNH